MDANTKQKTLTGVLTALLLGAVFVGAVPTAQAAHATPGANLPDVIVDVGQTTTATFAGTTQAVNVVVTPTDGNVRFNTTYDVTFTNIEVSAGGYGASGPGYGPARSELGLRLYNPGQVPQPNPRNAVPDGAHPGRWNVTFPSQMFGVTGFWTLRDSLNNTVATFLVQPEQSLTVSLSQNTFQFSESNVTFVITVSPLASGQTATLEGTGIPASTQVQGPTGQYVFVGGLPEVGTFTIYANRSLDGDALPEQTGIASYTVTPSPLTVTDVDTTPKAGFNRVAKWNFTYPNGTAVFCPNAAGNCGGGNPLRIVNYNLSVNFSYGTLYSNTSTVNTGGTPGSLCLWTSTTGCATSPPGITGWAPVWQFDASGAELGVFSFRPDATWPAGSYLFTLTVNAKGAADSLQEFTVSWPFTPATPADVNVDILGNSTGFPGPTGTPVVLPSLNVTENVTGTGPAGSYTLLVDVTGNTQLEHPRVATTGTPAVIAGQNTRQVADAFGAGNVSITGDVILQDTLSPGVFSYDETTGRITLKGIVPTKYGGNVVIGIAWKGTTTTVTLPITRGAILTASPTELIVDTTSTVTFTVRDDFGNPVPDAKILLWLKPSGSASGCNFLCGATAINGTGAPGAGQNGQYTLTLKPASIGRYIAYTQIGHEATATGSDTRRFAYLELNVVPAHDVNLTVTPTTANAAVATAFSMNATIPDGRSLGTNAIFYLLSEKQRADQIANLSLTTGVSPPAACAPGQIWTPGQGCIAYTTQLVNGGVVAYNFTASLPSGTWYVYACGNAAGGVTPAAGCTDARHDNNQSLATITVNPFRATFTPAQIANNPNIQSNTTVNVTVTDAAGAPWNGTLLLNSTGATGTFGCIVASGTCTPGAAVTSYAVTITNGNGSFVATGRDVGDVAWDFDPLSSNTPVLANLVDGVFRVVGPNVTVTPDRIPIGKASTITVNVRSLNGTPMVNLSVRMCGTPIGGTDATPQCTGTVLTDAAGNAIMGVNPISTGILTLYVNNVTAGRTVTVYAGLVITFVPSAPRAGDTVTGTVAQVGATGGEAGVTISVTRNGTAVSGFPQTTGTNGQFVLSNVQEGTYTVTASKLGFQNQTETLVVGRQQQTDNQTGARFELSNLVAPSTGAVGQAMTVTADVRNTGTAAGTATVLLLVNGQVRDTRSIPVNAGGQETVAFDFTPAQAGSLKVTVKLATGETLAEKTVTVNQQTTTTTTTTGQTTTTTTQTPTTTTTPTPRVPGFEVVALIGALAVALLVLRRRS
ncbi:MAG TPA: CARDB domain-containing protein [Candidatus Thermoplasmatota archaeon]|nr:CARDB domain-containing protein [Candidatus Thermoplasmatota archaeon]